MSEQNESREPYLGDHQKLAHVGQMVIIMPGALPCCREWFVDSDDTATAIEMPEETKFIVTGGLAIRERARFGIDGRENTAKLRAYPPSLVFDTLMNGPVAVPLVDLHGLTAKIDSIPD